MDTGAEYSPLTTEPVWPWSIPGVGLPALAVVAVLLLAVAVWTYYRVPNATLKRVGVVLGLRIIALFLVFLSLTGASCVSQSDLKVPSIVLVGLDLSKSMALVKDEIGDRTRYDEMMRIVKEVQPALERLQKEHNISVVFYRFGDHVEEFDRDNPAPATDDRTDTAQLLQFLYDRYRGEKYLRGLLIHSDGADNVASDPSAQQRAASFRSLCPIYTFKYGNPGGFHQNTDIIVTSLTADPSIVSVKGKLTLRATVDALGFVNSRVRVSAWFGDKEIKAEDAELKKRKDNIVEIVVDAPADPGEIRVTLKIQDPSRPGQVLPGELSATNNEMSTYVTVSREGLSVLLIERQDRFPEPQLLLSALAADKRIRVYRAWLRGKDVVTEDGKGLLDFDQQPYDVILLGDVTAEWLKSADAEAFNKIKDRVENKKTGLMIMGGRQAISKRGWGNTPIESLLPVMLDGGEPTDPDVTIAPTAEGLDYVMRLADKPEDSKAKWVKLPLSGHTPLGTVKPGSVRLANDGVSGLPLLVGRNVGTGRTLAFAGDTTYRWMRPNTDGVEAHSRFWRQVVLWLAQQENTDDNLRIRLDTRRLRIGDNLGFGVELQGKQGETIKDARYTVKVIDAKNGETPVEVIPGVKGATNENEQRGRFRPKLAGEHRVVVTATGTDPKGTPVEGKGEARFEAFQDDAESTEKSPNHEFLIRLAKEGGGKDYRPGELKQFLEQLPSKPLQSRPKPAKTPDWERGNTKKKEDKASPFLLAFMLLFVQVLATEWFLRRKWGMV